VQGRPCGEVASEGGEQKCRRASDQEQCGEVGEGLISISEGGADDHDPRSRLRFHRHGEEAGGGVNTGQAGAVEEGGGGDSDELGRVQGNASTKLWSRVDDLSAGDEDLGKALIGLDQRCLVRRLQASRRADQSRGFGRPRTKAVVD
jgi:hypothetical protein